MGLTLSKHGATVTRRALPARKPLVGSDQQEAFWDAAVNGSAHVVLEARAGCGKSTSAREAMWRLLEADRNTQATYVAFNKSIAAEFQHGLPPGTSASTMHSAGYAALRAELPHLDGTEPRPYKVRNFAASCIEGASDDAKLARSAVVKLVSLCKANLLPATNAAALSSLVVRYGVRVPKGWDDEVFEATAAVLERCKADLSCIDFDDMVWLPTVLGLSFPPIDCLFVDECQDLSPVQHAFVRLMVGQGRLILIGDPRQSIYSFRGADTRSMGTLANQLKMTRRGMTWLPLTRTRRCPRLHVELAQGLVPDFESMPDAPDGTIRDKATPAVLMIPGTMVLSRVNSDLVSLAYQLVAEEIPVAIQGRDLGQGLVNLIRSFRVATVGELEFAIEAYQDQELARLDGMEDADEERSLLKDRCDCLYAAVAGCDTVKQVTDRIDRLFQDVSKADQGGCVLLSSVHRAKGREANRVAIVRPDLMPHPMARTPEARDQEANLAYVAVTRSKNHLAFVGERPAYFTTMED